ncbi:MAG: hypothetical protein ACFFDQ_08520 [Candidatus Thorarchaeota archaeon]
MFRKQSGKATLELEIKKRIGLKHRGICVFLILSIVALVVILPLIQSWITMPQRTYTAIFVFRSENLLWHSGQLTITYEDGYKEYLTPFGMDGFESNPTYAEASQNFTQPESWSIEYYCSGLNLTVGPISFVTDRPKLLYDDAHGHIIELWFGEDY